MKFEDELKLKLKTDKMEDSERYLFSTIQTSQINNDTSICIIEDVNKYIYQQKKKEREASKNKSKTVLKEMKLSLNIGEHDMIHKANKTMEMLQDGCKVKVSLFLAGREINRTNEAINVIKSFIEKCAPCSCDKEPKVEGKVVSAVIFKK